ncbi:MAG: bifunctional UDP-N-acetylmuramoyl-tripeptide:D-alanyl-D-alanine ligase/alanine racemase [Marinifilaceae bacterium]|jgi:alanine racemase|nr:bifunctional UDP-N-acetylmuramoyl-tripeptide:D-alanyl-D-alanine ligase/alanine racemase [Marinifilaceae bacterium]
MRKEIYTVSEIANITKAKIFGNKENKINKISTDSRTIFSSELLLFVAIEGENLDGHKYINTAIKKGCKSFLINKLDSISNFRDNSELSFLLVNNSIEAVQLFARHKRLKTKIPIVGITGSNGKTIVKEWLYQLLSKNINICRSPKSYNSQIGVPLSVLQIGENNELGIFEAGISKKKEMQKLKKIIEPKIGIFTCLSNAHSENFENDIIKLNEKLDLFIDCECIFYNEDEKDVAREIKKRFKSKELYSWSRIDNKSKLYILEEKIQANKTSISAIFNNSKINIEIPFTDIASRNNAITSWLFCLVKFPNISLDFGKLEQIAMRLERKQGKNNSIIINDYYNSDLLSLEIGLDWMLMQQTDLKKTLILSDFSQISNSDKNIFSKVNNLLEAKGIDKLVGIGKNISQNSRIFKNLKESIFYKDIDEFILKHNLDDFSKEIILLKAARKFKFEKISNLLEESNHNTVLEINLNSIIHNLNCFRSKLDNSVKTMVMVKAFSYGLGAKQIAGILKHHRVDYLAVAITDEAVELRKAGIDLPIMVLNPQLSNFQTIIDYSLEPEIYNFHILENFNSFLERNCIDSYPIHIKLDTGMSRLGFLSEDIDKLITYLKLNTNCFIKSIFSHLAAADEKQHDEFTFNQIENFDQLSKKIINSFNYNIIRHILNSAGIERFPDKQFDMVRLGIGLYGVSNYSKTKVQKVVSLKSKIIHIKNIQHDQSVGYGRKGSIKAGGKIATIPIGYADGLSRGLSNGVGEILVEDKLCPIIGNICMDMCMIDISGLDSNIGDEVVLFGENPSIESIAKKLNTIPYEILTSISQRVKRIYFQD